MQCGKANSFWVVLIKICISLNSFPGKVSASCLDFVGKIFSVCDFLCCSFLSFMRHKIMGKKFYPRSPAVLWLYDSIVFAGLI